MPCLRVLQEVLVEYSLHGLHELTNPPTHLRKTLTKYKHKNKNKNKNKRIKQKQQQTNKRTANKTLSQNLEPFVTFVLCSFSLMLLA